MKKTWIVILLISVLLLVPACVLAEEAGSVSAEGLQLSMQFQYMPSIKPIQGTNLVTMESKTDNSLGVFTSDGQEVIPYGLSAV